MHTAKSGNRASACGWARLPTTRGRGVGAPAASRPDVEGNTALNAKVLRLMLALVPRGAFVLAIAILVAAGPGIVGLGFGLVGLVALAVAVSLYVLAYIRRSGRLLRQREERFRDIAELSDDWIWETDAENKLTFVSDRKSTRLNSSH